MNEVILMSIRPEWLVKILNGEKTIEIRKSMPKCELPIDVYLYCTKGKPYLVDFGDNEYPYKSGGYVATSDLYNIKRHEVDILNGKVVAKFTLNELKIEEITPRIKDLWKEDTLDNDYKTSALNANQLIKKAYMNWDELDDYLKCEKGYAWHIDNLVVFDEPKELREFSIFKRETITCGMDCPPYTDWVEYRVRKAPQSWQYVWR